MIRLARKAPDVGSQKPASVMCNTYFVHLLFARMSQRKSDGEDTTEQVSAHASRGIQQLKLSHPLRVPPRLPARSPHLPNSRVVNPVVPTACRPSRSTTHTSEHEAPQFAPRERARSTSDTIDNFDPCASSQQNSVPLDLHFDPSPVVEPSYPLTMQGSLCIKVLDVQLSDYCGCISEA